MNLIKSFLFINYILNFAKIKIDKKNLKLFTKAEQ